MTLNHYLGLSCILFAIGMGGLILRRNLLIILMCMEIMLTAANLAIIAFTRFHSANGVSDYSAQSMVFFVMTVAAAEVAIGLSIVIVMYKSHNFIRVNDLTKMQY